MLHQLGLAPAPALGEVVAQHAAGIGRRPHVAPRDIEQDAADGLVAARRDDALLGGLAPTASCVAKKRVPTSTPSAPSISAAARPRPSATPPAAATGMPRAASTTAGTSANVPRATPWPPASAPCATSTSAPFATASFACSTRLDLADHQRAGLFDLVRVRPDVTERQHDRRRLALQRKVEQARVLRHAPGDEADADARVARRVQLARRARARCRSRRR